MNLERKIWIRFTTTGVIFLAMLFVPYKSTTSPQWLIQVVDANGTPVPHFPVRQEWSYFGIDLAPNVDFGQTNSQGRVTFPRRIIWASLASRLLNPRGASEKLGPSVWIEACDDRSMMGEFFWEGNRFSLGGTSARTERIVVKAEKHCTFT